jgi:SAM-dependent methyltransferase
VRGTPEQPEVQAADGTWIALHPSADPAAGSDEVVTRLAARGLPPVLVVIGIGAGYLLDALERVNAPTRVLAIEPAPATVRAMFARRDWTRWITSGRLTLLVGPAYAGAAEAWRLFPAGVEHAPSIASPWLNAWPALAAEGRAVAAHILSGVQANAEARRQFAGRYLTQTIENLGVIGREGDVTALRDALAGVPAVVVGAGPSLDRRLDLVRDLSDRAVVIAADTATRPLRAAGVRVDLVVAVDPSETNARHLVGLDLEPAAWLVAEPSVAPVAFRAFAGRTFTFAVADHEPWPWLHDAGVTRGALKAWGSVLTTAFDLALWAGCGPIVFVGADLAYSRGLQYCRNTTYEPLWADCADDQARAARFRDYLATRPHGPTPDLAGAPVLTAPHFVQFRDWIVARAGEWTTAAPGRRVLNASGEGILFGGAITQATPDEALGAVSASATPVVASRQRLAEAYQASVVERAETLTRVDDALARSVEARLPAWLAFGGDTRSEADIRAAVASATADVATARLRSRGLAATRAVWDAQVSAVAARQVIHPRYDVFEAQAEAQCRHALADWRERQALATAARGLGADPHDARGHAMPRRVLDVGCGLGRTMRPWHHAGVAVDGVDSSARMLALALADADAPAGRWFRSSGHDCGAAPDAAYDLVTRQRLLEDMARVLTPGGVVHLQVPLLLDRTPDTVPPPHVPWTAADDAALAAAGVGEVRVTPADLPDVLADVGAHFHDVRFQVVEFAHAPLFTADLRERRAHLLISASRGPALADVIYATVPADN